MRAMHPVTESGPAARLHPAPTAMRPQRQLAASFLVVILLLVLADCVGAKKKKMKKKYEVRRHKDGPLPNPAVPARCSACRAVASDLSKRLEPFEVRHPTRSARDETSVSAAVADLRGVLLLCCGQGKSIGELRMIELIEGPGAKVLGNNLGHLCMAMKIRWHYTTIMEAPDLFGEEDVKSFPTRAGEPLA